MSRTIRCALALAFGLRSLTAGAQIEVVSEPVKDYLLDITRNWSRDSPLGDLRERQAGAADIKVRAWGGYGLTRTGAVIARREAGTWHAWMATVVHCNIWVPEDIADSASKSTRERFKKQAREQCNEPQDHIVTPATGFSSDSIEVIALPVSSATIDSAWSRVVAAGVLTLPPHPTPERMMLDGFTYVIEVRQGSTYRASVITHVRKPQAESDSQVQQVFAILAELTHSLPD
jgi:hypothetical protein